MSAAEAKQEQPKVVLNNRFERGEYSGIASWVRWLS
jgi:hypothetical protein